MSNQKILLVEDDDFLREVYESGLTEAGYQIDTAVDGEQAYAKMKQGGWDLILCDILIPKMTGIEVVKKLKSENVVLPKIVFLTNLDQSPQLNETKLLGYEHLIKSDMNPGEFLEKVKAFLK